MDRNAFIQKKLLFFKDSAKRLAQIREEPVSSAHIIGIAEIYGCTNLIPPKASAMAFGQTLEAIRDLLEDIMPQNINDVIKISKQGTDEDVDEALALLASKLKISKKEANVILAAGSEAEEQTVFRAFVINQHIKIKEENEDDGSDDEEGVFEPLQLAFHSWTESKEEKQARQKEETTKEKEKEEHKKHTEKTQQKRDRKQKGKKKAKKEKPNKKRTDKSVPEPPKYVYTRVQYASGQTRYKFDGKFVPKHLVPKDVIKQFEGEQKRLTGQSEPILDVSRYTAERTFGGVKYRLDGKKITKAKIPKSVLKKIPRPPLPPKQEMGDKAHYEGFSYTQHGTRKQYYYYGYPIPREDVPAELFAKIPKMYPDDYWSNWNWGNYQAGNAFDPNRELHQKLLSSLGIQSRKDWKIWILKNHPDKNPGIDPELVAKVNAAMDTVYPS